MSIHRVKGAHKNGPITIDLSNPQVVVILGKLAFQMGPIAHVFQKAGHPIPTHAEEEQAWVISWLLTLHEEHGEGWAAAANAEIKAMLAEQETAVKP